MLTFGGPDPSSYPHPSSSQLPPMPQQQGVYGGIPNIGTQAYLPVMEKHDLEKPEQKEIKRGLSQWWPRIGAGYSTPIPQLLADPLKSGILSAIGTGIVGAVIGVLAIRSLLSLVVGGALGMLIGGVMGFINRRQQNENILDLMQRLPQGATKRDLLSDPVYQADLTRQAAARANSGGDLFTTMAMASMMNGGGLGGAYRGGRRR